MFLFQISKEAGISKQDLFDEAAFILDEMSHNLTMKVLRSFCYFLLKALKCVFHRIYVNEEGAQKVCYICGKLFSFSITLYTIYANIYIYTTFNVKL